MLASWLPGAPGATAPEAFLRLPRQMSPDLSLALSRSSAHPGPIIAAKVLQTAEWPSPRSHAPSFLWVGKLGEAPVGGWGENRGALLFRGRMNGNWSRGTPNAVFMGMYMTA